jgi:hypothetical protein
MSVSIKKINILYFFKLKVLFSLLVGLCLCGCDSIRNNNADILYPDNSTMQIWNQTDLDNIRNCLSCDYILMADIELVEGRCGFDPLSGWLPISDFNNNYEYFTGTFDGNNHKITGLWIDRVHYVGLFGGLDGATIKNLSVEIDESKGIKGNVSVGVIAGTLMRSNITDSYATGNVSGFGKVGGIAGELDLFSNIANSSFAGNISASAGDVGGIAGYVHFSSITQGNFMGNVNSSGQFIGGIAGSVEYGNIADSYSDGNINGDVHVGGIVGSINFDSFVTSSHFAGSVTGNYNIGGIAGHMDFNSFIAKSHSTGNINGNEGIGGIAGHIRESNITNSYSTGNINGNNSIGGVTGWTQYGNITNSYSVGNISGNWSVGGITGWNEGGNITNNYFGGAIEGADYVGGIVGMTSTSSSVKYNAALNPFITVVGGSYDIGRIIGNINGNNNDIVGNIALDTMDIKIIVNNGSNQDGTGKSEGDLKMQLTYETIGWKFGTNDDKPWQIDNNGLLYLYWQK